MKKSYLWIAAIIAAALLASVGCGPTEPVTTVAVDAELLARGQATYKINCVPCHGPEGKGDGPSAASLNPKPRNHSDPALMDKLTDRKIGETVRMGGVVSGYPNMPASPHIKGDDLVALVAFVRSLHRPDVASVDLEGYAEQQ